MSNDTYINRNNPPVIRPIEPVLLPHMGETVLPGGLRVKKYISRGEQLAGINILWRGGQSALGGEALGALYAEMLREGTYSHTGFQINSAIDRSGAAVGISAHPHHMQLRVLALPESLPKLMPILREIILESKFPEKSFRSKRDTLASNIAIMERNVDYLAACESDKQIKGPEHPLAVCETQQSVKNLSVADFRAKYHDVIDDFSATVYLSGNITAQAERSVVKTFGDIEGCDSGVKNIVPYSPLPALDEKHVVLDESVQSSMYFTLPSPPRIHPDYIPLHIAVSVLGGYFGGRLMTNIREKLGLTYGISAQLFGSHDGAYVQIGAQTSPENCMRLRDEVEKEISDMSVREVNTQESRRFGQWAIASENSITDSPFAVASYHIAEELSGIPAGYFDEKMKALSNLSADDIMRVSRKYLRPELLRVAWAGK